MMYDLVQWLRAQLDEDERAARAADIGCDLFDGTGIVVMHTHASGSRSVTLPSNIAAFVATHDPARVLREVEAKRRILDAYAGALASNGYVRFGDWESCSDGCPETVMENVVKLLALPYSDRPGYRTEWRP